MTVYEKGTRSKWVVLKLGGLGGERWGERTAAGEDEGEGEGEEDGVLVLCSQALGVGLEKGLGRWLVVFWLVVLGEVLLGYSVEGGQGTGRGQGEGEGEEQGGDSLSTCNHSSWEGDFTISGLFSSCLHGGG